MKNKINILNNYLANIRILEKQLIELGVKYSHSESTNRLFIYIGNFTYQCSFIHQFQNLYFDLTTVELAVA